MTTLATFPLRLPKSIKAEAERQSRDDGTSLNQFIAIAVAEKIAARQTAAFFEERARRTTGTALWDLLDRPGGEPPRPGDELPEGYVPLPRGQGVGKAKTGKPPAATSKRKAASPAADHPSDLSAARARAAEPSIARDEFVARLTEPAAPAARRPRGERGPAR